MKNILLLLSCLFAGSAFGTPNIHEALKNPSTVTVLQLNGTINESNLLLKNAKRFSSLEKIIITGISDSILAEQDLIAVAACSHVSKLAFDKCGFAHLSGAIKMLVSVQEVEISNCEKLEINSAFSSLAGMPSLNSISYSTAQLQRMPQSFTRMRAMKKISISNTDLSLADGYALNYSNPTSLFAKEELELGFGENSLILEYSCYDKTSAREHISIMRDMLQGANGMNKEIILPQRPKAFTRENPLVKPPIAGLDVRKNIYTTNATTGGVIEYPSGTKIFIPDHAFVDANGNAVEGNVTIDYREFRDQVDILLSGIPMTYDSAGVKGNFESAGMFELNASVNGQEVFLASGKKVDIEFSVVDTASTYNFYRLDAKKGWEYQNTTGTVESKVDNSVGTKTGGSTIVVSQAARDFVNRTMYNRRKKPALNDTTAFDRIYSDTSYFYMTKNTTATKLSVRKRFKESTKWRMQKVTSGKGEYCFYLTNRYKSTMYGDNNPEMSVYRHIIWRLNDSQDKQTLRNLRSIYSGVNDIRVSYQGGSDYSIELKLPNGFMTISASPVYVNYKGERKEISEKRCKQMDKNYNKILKNRKRGYTNAIHHRIYMIKRWDSRMHLDSLKQWNQSKKMMSGTELAMDFPNWVAYAKKNGGFNYSTGSFSTEATQQSGAVYQALSVMKFGVYNCDQIQRMKNPVQVFALAYTNGNVPQNAAQMFVVDKNKNQVFSYNGFSGAPIQIAFGEKEENKLIVVNEDGSVAFSDVNQFNERKGTPQGNTRFESIAVSEKPVSTQQLREIIFPVEVKK